MNMDTQLHITKISKIYIYIYLYVHIFFHIDMYVCIYSYIYMCIRMHIYTYTYVQVGDCPRVFAVLQSVSMIHCVLADLRWTPSIAHPGWRHRKMSLWTLSIFCFAWCFFGPAVLLLSWTASGKGNHPRTDRELFGTNQWGETEGTRSQKIVAS